MIGSSAGSVVHGDGRNGLVHKGHTAATPPKGERRRRSFEVSVEHEDDYPVNYSCPTIAAAIPDTQQGDEEKEEVEQQRTIRTSSMTLEFDYEFVIENPDEPMVEVLVQDLPMLEFGILWRVAEVAGVTTCNLTDQKIDLFSTTNFSTVVIGLSSLLDDTYDYAIAGECEFLVALAEDDVCLPMKGSMTATYVGNDTAAVASYVLETIAEEMNSQRVLLGTVRETYFLGSRPPPQPTAAKETSEGTRRVDSQRNSAALASALTIASALVLLLCFGMIAQRRRSEADRMMHGSSEVITDCEIEEVDTAGGSKEDLNRRGDVDGDGGIEVEQVPFTASSASSSGSSYHTTVSSEAPTDDAVRVGDQSEEDMQRQQQHPPPPLLIDAPQPPPSPPLPPQLSSTSDDVADDQFTRGASPTPPLMTLQSLPPAMDETPTPRTLAVDETAPDESEPLLTSLSGEADGDGDKTEAESFQRDIMNADNPSQDGSENSIVTVDDDEEVETTPPFEGLGEATTAAAAATAFAVSITPTSTHAGGSPPPPPPSPQPTLAVGPPSSPTGDTRGVVVLPPLPPTPPPSGKPPKATSSSSSSSSSLAAIAAARSSRPMKRRRKKKKKKKLKLIRTNSRESIVEMDTITEAIEEEKEQSGDDNEDDDDDDNDEDGGSSEYSWETDESDSRPGSRDPSPARSLESSGDDGSSSQRVSSGGSDEGQPQHHHHQNQQLPPLSPMRTTSSTASDSPPDNGKD